MSYHDQSAYPDNPEALLRALCSKDLELFLMKGFPILNGGAPLLPNWHIGAIAHQLERVVRGECRRLIINTPPRALKSFAASVGGVAWMLGVDPRLSIVCASYSNDLSNKLARGSLGLMQSAWYRAVFPHTRLSAHRSAASDFETSLGGGRLATSVTGTLTGRGGDILIIDDPLKADDAYSDTIRKATNEWFRSTLLSRLDNKEEGAIIVVMQRLHEDDLTGMLLESGGWEVLNLPAIAIEDQTIPLSRKRVHHRKAGDVLHPTRESLASLEDMKRALGSAVFSAQYQQQPVPSGGVLVQRDWMARYDHAPDRQPGDRIVQAWDCASKDGPLNDWSVGITALVRRREVYLLDVYRARLTFPDLCKQVIATPTYRSRVPSNGVQARKGLPVSRQAIRHVSSS